MIKIECNYDMRKNWVLLTLESMVCNFVIKTGLIFPEFRFELVKCSET